MARRPPRRPLPRRAGRAGAGPPPARRRTSPRRSGPTLAVVGRRRRRRRPAPTSSCSCCSLASVIALFGAGRVPRHAHAAARPTSTTSSSRSAERRASSSRSCGSRSPDARVAGARSSPGRPDLGMVPPRRHVPHAVRARPSPAVGPRRGHRSPRDGHEHGALTARLAPIKAVPDRYR